MTNNSYPCNRDSDPPLSITGLITNNGELCGYRLSNNRFVSCEEGLEMVKSGLLQNCLISPRNEQNDNPVI